MGLGLVILHMVDGDEAIAVPTDQVDLVEALDRFRQAFSSSVNSFELSRGMKLFEGTRLYLLKPLGQRYWSETAALNDADEIAGSILMHSSETGG